MSEQCSLWTWTALTTDPDSSCYDQRARVFKWRLRLNQSDAKVGTKPSAQCRK